MNCRQTFIGTFNFKSRIYLDRVLSGSCEDISALTAFFKVADLDRSEGTLTFDIDQFLPYQAWTSIRKILRSLGESAESGTVEATCYLEVDRPLFERIVAPVVPDVKHQWNENQKIIETLDSGNLRAIEALIKTGETPNRLMHLATQIDRPEMIRFLCKAGADANGREGRRPLRWTAQYGFIASSQVLLEEGADPNLLDVEDYVQEGPLHMAVLHGHLDLIRLLIENGAEVNLLNSSGKTPLQMLLANKSFFKNRDHSPIVDLLSSFGAK